MLNSASDIVEGDDIVKYNGKTIKKRTDGRYWTRYYVNGIQKSVYGRTQKECLLEWPTEIGTYDIHININEIYETIDGKDYAKYHPLHGHLRVIIEE